MILFSPFIGFWVLVIVGRNELGLKGIAFSILLWLGLFIGFRMLSHHPYWFVGAQALFDAILVVVIFGGDIRIR